MRMHTCIFRQKIYSQYSHNLWKSHVATATFECRCRACVRWKPRCAVATIAIDFACTRNWPAAMLATSCPVLRQCWRLAVETSLRRKLQHVSFCAFDVALHATLKPRARMQTTMTTTDASSMHRLQWCVRKKKKRVREYLPMLNP